VSAPGVPTAEERLAFLTQLERLLSEGAFVATYKYALLIALTELAVERGDDSGAAFTLPVRDIAEKFIALYWRHAAPYGSHVDDEAGDRLSQSTSKGAAMIRRVMKLRKHYRTLASARRGKEWQHVTAQTTRLLIDMPLWRLQRLRRGTLEFLYREGDRADEIVLLPGVVTNLRYFNGFITRTVRSEWLRFVQELPANQAFLGATVDLADFLFGRDRRALGRAGNSLRELQSGRCFYCEGTLRAAADVDHFIPWSRYPRDLVHNLVATHRKCNANKSNLLAAEPYRARWTLWILERDADLADIGRQAGLIVDRPTAQRVAEWSYGHARQIGAEVWMGGNKYAKIRGNSATRKALPATVRSNRRLQRD
jgi:hypothetical protein